MRIVTLKLTTDELALLTTLATDQLFRKEFIDPRMPGYKANASDIRDSKALIARLRSMLDGVPGNGSVSSKISRVASGEVHTRQIG